MKSSLNRTIQLFCFAIFSILVSCTSGKLMYSKMSNSKSKTTEKEQLSSNEKPEVDNSTAENIQSKKIEVTESHSFISPTSKTGFTKTNDAAGVHSVPKVKKSIENKIKPSTISKSQEIAQMKKAIEEKLTLKKNSERGTPSTEVILLYVLAVLIPFLAVGLVTDWDILQVIITLLLCFCFFLPGIIYALYMVSKNT